MSLYINSDVDLVKKNWDKIMEQVEKERYKVLEPSYDEMLSVHNIILDFIKSKKRKIYGGYALNALVKQKNPKDAIYKKDKISDIDIYSPKPISDLMELCNILFDKGFKYVIGREAMHKETYSLWVNTLLYCDISYVPKNIYDRLPFRTIDGLNMIHPHFMMIDYLRMLTDPILSYWRFENDLKGFKRFVLLQKYYPLPYSDNSIDIESVPELDVINKHIFKYMTNKKSILVIGFYAYNYFLNESGILKDKSNKLNILNIPYYEFISSDYRHDALTLIDELKKISSIDSSSITYKEYYPFFQFTGFSVDIYYNDELIVRIYSNNRKYIPYQDVNVYDIKFEKKIKDSKIRLGIFPIVLQYGLINLTKARTNNDNTLKDLYYTFCSQIISMRNYYLEMNNKTILDDTIFREFVVNGIGDTIQPDRERMMLIESKKKQNKRYMFRYEPTADGIKDPDIGYIFANSSGNAITNPKNLRLSGLMKDDSVEDDSDIADVTDLTDLTDLTSVTDLTDLTSVTDLTDLTSVTDLISVTDIEKMG